MLLVVPPAAYERRHRVRNDEIADWLVRECEAIPGWSWTPIRDRQQRDIDNLRAFVRAHGWGALSVEKRVGGVLLADWAAMRRVEYKRGDLADWIVRALEAIPGWTWSPLDDGHRRNLFALRGHIARHGWAGFDQVTTSRNGIHIGKWANHIRSLHRQSKLPRWLIAALESIPGWTWEPLRARQVRRSEILRKFVETHGWGRMDRHLVVRGIAIGTWLYGCRSRYASGSGISRETAAALESIPGFQWERRRAG